jgi:hypothetical protein
MERETITAVLGSSVGLAGILLVFIGFVYSRVETFEQSDRVRKYRLVARLGALPFLLALISAWMCLKWLDAPSADLYVNAILAFQACLILTGIYGIVALVFYL